MSCAATPLTVWLLLGLLFAVALMWGALELHMFKKGLDARHRAECHRLWEMATTALTELDKHGLTQLKPVKGGWVRAIKDPS